MMVKYVQIDVAWLLVLSEQQSKNPNYSISNQIKQYQRTARSLFALPLNQLFMLLTDWCSFILKYQKTVKRKSPSGLLACLVDCLGTKKNHYQISGNFFGTCNVFIHCIRYRTAVWLLVWGQLYFSFLDFYFISHLRKPGEPVIDLLHLICILCTEVKVLI